MLVSGPLRRRLDELERAVEGIKEAGVAGEERRAYWECFYPPNRSRLGIGSAARETGICWSAIAPLWGCRR